MVRSEMLEMSTSDRHWLAASSEWCEDDGWIVATTVLGSEADSWSVK